MFESDTVNLGPYQLQKKIGSGGMGEVHLAFDSRLKRNVAIKCLKNEASSELKKRLATEAEILAQLDSENIVKVYDVFETDGCLYLVMEYVDGVTLNQWLVNNRPSLRQILNISQQILKALQVAHQAQIIHRDLKADNILVYQGELIKLTDFGIAKSLTSVFTEHTVAGRITGSYTAMSPEQALRKTLDQRTDFFSFGLLLYRMLTAHHAFGDNSNPIKVIDRIIHDNPTPITRYLPDCPIQLIKLIQQLLEKSPARRPANAQTILESLAKCVEYTAEENPKTQIEVETKAWRPLKSTWHKKIGLVSVLATMLIIVLSVCGYILFSHSPQRPALMIEPVQIESKTLLEEELALLNMAIHTSLNELAIESERYEVIERDAWLALNEQSNHAFAVAADQILKSEARCSEYNCKIVFKLVSAQNGHLIQTETINLLSDNLLAFKQNLMLSFNELLPKSTIKSSVNVISEQVYAAFLAVELKAMKNGNSSELLEEARILVKKAPFFLPGYISFNRLCINHFWDTLDTQHLSECETSLQHAAKIDAEDYQLAIAFFELMLAKGDLSEAKSWLTRLQKKYSGNSRVLISEAEWHFESGRHEQALLIIDKAIVSRENWMVLLKKARFLWQINRPSDALATLERLLRRAPGHFTALRLKATIHSYLGEFSLAATDYQRLLEHNEKNTALLNDLGTSLIYSGQYLQAIAVLEKAYELDSKDPYISLNLADSFSLNRQPESAEHWYLKTLELSKRSRQDLRLYAIDAQAHAQLNNVTEAINALQKFQKLNSNEAETAYFSALVYTLIGDRHSAAVNRARAIELGISPSWFQLSWFETSQEVKE